MAKSTKKMPPWMMKGGHGAAEEGKEMKGKKYMGGAAEEKAEMKKPAKKAVKKVAKKVAKKGKK